MFSISIGRFFLDQSKSRTQHLLRTSKLEDFFGHLRYPRVVKKQSELDCGVTLGQQVQKFVFSKSVREHQFLALLTESDVTVKLGLLF